MAHPLIGASAALVAAIVLMLPTAAAADSGHEHAPPSADPHAEHDMGSDHDHGTTHQDGEDDDAGHTDHGTDPDSVSPEVRNLVLSGFAGVNVAVVFGAWLMRRTGPDPDPRKRAPKAPR